MRERNASETKVEEAKRNKRTNKNKMEKNTQNV
jgi:hypothetical protein